MPGAMATASPLPAIVSAASAGRSASSVRAGPASALPSALPAQHRAPSARPCLLGGASITRSRPKSTGRRGAGVRAAVTAVGKARVTPDPHWMDFLRFDGKPTFDVLERAQEYSNAQPETFADFRADDYIFRGPIIGPITGEDVQETQKFFRVEDAYPDLDRGIFGHTVDPENPYKVYWFERWTATNTGTLNMLGLQDLPPTGKVVSVPTHVTSVVFNPDGKIVYEALSSPLDRFEGNTKGAGAVFGLLGFAGAPAGQGSVGDAALVLQQRLFKALGGAIGSPGKPWSDEDKIPRWWRSRARGADPNDM